MADPAKNVSAKAATMAAVHSVLKCGLCMVSVLPVTQTLEQVSTPLLASPGRFTKFEYVNMIECVPFNMNKFVKKSALYLQKTSPKNYKMMQ